MISFIEFVKKIYGEELVGIYPPEYEAIGTYPDSYFTRRTPYLDASRHAKTTPRKRKRRKKK